MSNLKKKNKRVAHATMVWERDQLKIATAAEALTKAVAVVEQYRDELTDEQYTDVMAKFELQKEELQKFATKARDKYAKKMAELNVEAVVFDGKESIVNLEDLNANV
jgi:hypothetical protein